MRTSKNLSRRLRAAGIMLLALAGGVLCFASPALASEGVLSTFGGTGTAGGLFTTVGGVAVNESSQDVYVADTGNNRIQEFTSSGTFIRAWGEGVVNTGAPNESDATQALRVDATAGEYTLTFEGDTTAPLAPTVSAATVRGALEALASIGTNNVTVSGGPGNALGSTPYIVTFVGALKEKAEALMTVSVTSPLTGGFANSGATANTATVVTANPGATGFDICDTTVATPDTAAQCKAGTATATGGGMKEPTGVAVNQSTGDVYVYDKGYGRVDEFDSTGHFIRAWGSGVVSSGPDKADAQLALTVKATEGTFTLTHSGQTTSPGIAYNAPANKSEGTGSVEEALENLSNIGTGNVTVTGGPGDEKGTKPYVVTFVGALGGATETITASASALKIKEPSGTTKAGTATPSTPNPGATGFDICTAANGDVCETGNGSIINNYGGAFSQSNATGYPVVDPSTGDVVVTDSNNRRIQVFSPDGEFLYAFGKEVVSSGPDDEGAVFDWCIAGTGDLCKSAAPGGSGVGQFGTSGPTEVAVDSTGSIYAIDSSNYRVQKFRSISGLPPLMASIFSPTVLTGTSSTTAPTTLAIEPNAITGDRLLAVKPVSATESQILELVSEGSLAGTHYVGSGTGLPVSTGLAYEPGSEEIYYATAAGNTSGPYVIPANSVAILSFTPATVAKPSAMIEDATGVTASEATFHGQVNPNGFETTARFEYSSNGTTWQEVASSLENVGSGTSNVPVTATVRGLASNALYVVRLVAKNAGGTDESGATDLVTSPIKPVIEQPLATPVGATSATLTAYVNPENSPTSYRFEYGTSETYTSTVPVLGREIGSGGQLVHISEEITGLQPDTTYHFKLLAANESGTEESTDQTFTTQTATGGCQNEQARSESNINAETATPYSEQLAECRAYEMVTPPYKDGAAVISGFSPDHEVSFDGTNYLFNSNAVFAGSINGESQGYGDTYDSTRTAEGWQTSGLSPTAKIFSSLERKALSASGEATLWQLASPERDAGVSSFYVREPKNADGECPAGAITEADSCFIEIGPTLPPITSNAASTFSQRGTSQAGEYVGASSDLSHVLFGIAAINAQYLWPGDGTPTSSTSSLKSLYEYAGTGHTGEDGDEPTLIGVDNKGAQVTTCGTKLAEDGVEPSHAVSADGSSVFWVNNVTGGCSGPAAGQVYARIGSEPASATTVNVAATGTGTPAECATSECGVTKTVTYQGAAGDGARVFFTTTQALRGSDADTTNDLYECVLPGDSGAQPAPTGAVNPCPDLIQVSAGEANAGTPGAESANVQSVAAVSSDGSHVYYIATGVLTGAPNQQGQTATLGADNLYVYDAGTGSTTFIATLPEASLANAQSTPDGDYLVFTSTGELTPGDTSSAEQVFRYDAQNGQLLRVSFGENDLADDGNTSTYAASIAPIRPYGASPVAGSVGAISNNGQDVVFTSQDALTANAVLGDTNVYEYSDGNVSLIYSQSSETVSQKKQDAEYARIDSSGEDIFFLAAGQLVGQDTDTGTDIYDARLDGGFRAPLAPAKGCEGEACQGALTAPLTPVIPGSTGTPANGNLVPGSTAFPTPEEAKTKAKVKTRAQKLAAALKSCKKDKIKAKRKACEAKARKKYGPIKKKKSKAKGKKP